MIARLVRYGLLFVSGLLVSKGIVPQEFADSWLTETTALLAGFVIVTIPVVWGYLKAKFDRKTVEAAVQMPPPTAETPTEIRAAVTEAKAIAAANSSTSLPY